MINIQTSIEFVYSQKIVQLDKLHLLPSDTAIWRVDGYTIETTIHTAETRKVKTKYDELKENKLIADTVRGTRIATIQECLSAIKDLEVQMKSRKMSSIGSRLHINALEKILTN